MASTSEEEEIVVVLYQLLNSIRIFMVLFMKVYESRRRRRQLLSSNRGRTYSLSSRAPDQRKHLNELVGLSDVTALDNIRMSRDTFGRLCYLLENIGGLSASRNVDVREQVAMLIEASCRFHARFFCYKQVIVEFKVDKPTFGRKHSTHE